MHAHTRTHPARRALARGHAARSRAQPRPWCAQTLESRGQTGRARAPRSRRRCGRRYAGSASRTDAAQQRPSCMRTQTRTSTGIARGGCTAPRRAQTTTHRIGVELQQVKVVAWPAVCPAVAHALRRGGAHEEGVARVALDGSDAPRLQEHAPAHVSSTCAGRGGGRCPPRAPCGAR